MAKRWDRDCALVVTAAARRAGWQKRPKGRKVVVELWAVWPDNRTRDMNNLHKQVADLLEGIVYENDSSSLLRDMDYTVDSKAPRLIVRWHDA